MMTFSADRPNHVLSTSGEEVLEMKVFFFVGILF
jgi:hypothetical protein